MSDTSPHDGAISFSCPDEVSKRVAQLYADERLADVTFAVQQGEDSPVKRFVAHRNIVSAWSRPLDRMLCGGFAEGSSREVRILDVEPYAFEAMLKLMYCGVTEITSENVLAVLDVSVRFDVAPLVQFSVQFLQNHTSSEHACRMLEVGVQYGLARLVDKCIELIVTDDHILESGDFDRLSQAAVIELAKHDSWNMHEDEIFDTMMRWAAANSSSEEEQMRLAAPILEYLRYPHMSIEKLKSLSTASNVPNQLIFEALFFLLQSPGLGDLSQLSGRFRPRPGSLLFSWVPTAKVTVSGEHSENARHTSSNGFTGVRGDRRMQHGVYSWTIDIAETQSSWIFVGVAQADDSNDVAWRSSGRMLYCLDSRVFHQGSGSNHPGGDRKVTSGDCLRVVLDCTRHTLAFGINSEKPAILFRDLPTAAYVPAVDLRDCGDKVRILSSNPHSRCSASAASCSRPSRSSHSRAQAPHDSPAPPTAASLETDPPALASSQGELFPDTTTPPPSAAAPESGLADLGSVPVQTTGHREREAVPTAAAPPELGAAQVLPTVARRPAFGWEGHPPSSSAQPHPVQGGHAAASGSAVRTLQPRQSQGSQGSAAVAANVAEPREDDGPPY